MNAERTTMRVRPFLRQKTENHFDIISGDIYARSDFGHSQHRC
jgi:hypothetical protein